MIINHEKKWVYIGPPKTSSTTMCYLLTDGTYQNNKWGKTLPDNFSGVLDGKQHTPFPPEILDEKYNDYFIFLTTRNPFERIISLWGHWKFGKNLEEPEIDKTNVELKDFLELILSVRDGKNINIGGNGFFHFTLSEWVKNYQAYVKIENIYNDLIKLNLHKIDFKIPHCNKNLTMRSKIDKPWQEFHTPTTIELTIKWAKKDFECFEYLEKL